MHHLPIVALTLATVQQGVLSADSRLFVVDGSDTTRYAVTDTVRFTVGRPVHLVADFRASDGTQLTIRWHNTAADYLSFERRLSWFSSGAVTATKVGSGHFMAHWGDTEQTSIDLTFSAVAGSGVPLNREERPRSLGEAAIAAGIAPLLVGDLAQADPRGEGHAELRITNRGRSRAVREITSNPSAVASA